MDMEQATNSQQHMGKWFQLLGPQFPHLESVAPALIFFQAPPFKKCPYLI